MVLACRKQLLVCAGDKQVYQSKGSCGLTAWPESSANWAEEHLLPVFERDRSAKSRVTYCVDARNLPSGLKAVAMVERGGGFRSQ